MPNPVVLLRWSLALVLGGSAALLLVSLARGEHVGVHAPLALAIGGAEVLAAVMLLIPRTIRVGGGLLLIVLVCAAALHMLAGKPPPLAFAIYIPAIWVVMRRGVIA
jgi:hypothetical protein